MKNKNIQDNYSGLQFHSKCSNIFLSGKSMRDRLLRIYSYGLMLGCVLIVVIIWMNEIWDLPHLLFNANKTPINWKECLLETFAISIIYGFNAIFTNYLFEKIRLLDGLLPICSVCKKIRVSSNQWVQIEDYVHQNSEVSFTLNICPECKPWQSKINS